MENLLQAFNAAMPFEEYVLELGEQKTLHDLHYKRAGVDGLQLPPFKALKILVITEPWCGDSTAILPVLQKLFAGHDVEFRIALRDENPELMDRFLTNGGRAIPVILILDEKGELLMRFGPRPQKVQAIFEQYRRDINEGRIERKEVSRKIRNFYSRDRGKAILEEFLPQLKKALEKYDTK